MLAGNAKVFCACVESRLHAGQRGCAHLAGAVPSASASDEDVAAALERGPGLVESDEDEAEADERHRDRDDEVIFDPDTWSSLR